MIQHNAYSVFLDNACMKIQNMVFKTSNTHQIALQYWYYMYVDLDLTDLSNMNNTTCSKHSSARKTLAPREEKSIYSYQLYVKMQVDGIR